MVRTRRKHLVEPGRGVTTHTATFVIVWLALAINPYGHPAAVEQHPGVGVDAASTSTPGSVGSYGMPTYRHQRRRLQQTVFTQLRPMSDTTKCLNVPGANYNNGNPLALAPCAAVPEQNYSLPAAGSTLAMYIGPVAAQKIVDLWTFNTTSGAVVVVSAAGHVSLQAFVPWKAANNFIVRCNANLQKCWCHNSHVQCSGCRCGTGLGVITSAGLWTTSSVSAACTHSTGAWMWRITP
jgi:hypothetical protein